MSDIDTSRTSNASEGEDVKVTLFGKRVSIGTIIILMQWVVGIFIISGLIVFQGLMSFYRYYDLIPLPEILNWIFRKDPLELSMEPLIYGLQAVTFIFGGVEVASNFSMNVDSIKGKVIQLPEKQLKRLISLVFLWFIMLFIVFLAKIFLGTRNVDYHTTEISYGFVISIVLLGAGRCGKIGNRVKGSKDKENEKIETAKAMNAAAKELNNGTRFEETKLS